MPKMFPSIIKAVKDWGACRSSSLAVPSNEPRPAAAVGLEGARSHSHPPTGPGGSRVIRAVVTAV